ncbi:hypothetical protein ACIBH1_03495 [Nonomuraea sp. NPDC050663]|uniref:hypothetical protein n=1 Tax=Nonomuraea sp. NPDC050663 TaxID=3364370 RepID=UPI0037BD268E
MNPRILMIAPLLGLALSVPAPATADPLGPCYVLTMAIGEREGARSICPPATWRHWHQVHVTCSFAGSTWTESGPMVGGTSVSEVLCGDRELRRRAWNTQGPDE